MYYGFDIGGTKIALGVFDSGRQLQWEKRVPTPRDSYDAFLDAVCELVAEADQRFGCKGSVGIGIPGMPETEDGTLYAANVPAASGKPLRADLSARLDRDVRLDNGPAPAPPVAVTSNCRYPQDPKSTPLRAHQHKGEVRVKVSSRPHLAICAIVAISTSASGFTSPH